MKAMPKSQQILLLGNPEMMLAIHIWLLNFNQDGTHNGNIKVRLDNQEEQSLTTHEKMKNEYPEYFDEYDLILEAIQQVIEQEAEQRQ